MTTDLREETIKGLRAEGAFDMDYYGQIESLVENKCGTACCLAGHIVAAAARLGITIDIPESSSWWPVPFAARELWKQAYGHVEATRLEFDTIGWGFNLSAVTVDEAIAHLNGAEPARHDDETDDE
jgi:hypothetical protein